MSFDEWNVWYHSNDADTKVEPWQVGPHLLEDIYNFEDALLVGSLLITLLKNSDRVKIGCLAQLVNVIAPIMTDTDGGVWLQSIFYPFMQVSNYGTGIALTPHVDVPTYSSREFDSVPYLDTITTYDKKTQTVTIFAENKNQQENIDFKADLNGFECQQLVETTQFCGYKPKDTNKDGKMKLDPLTEVNLSSNQVTAKLQPLSWNMIRISVK